MELRRPMTNVISKPVKNWKQIEKDAIEMRELANRKNHTGIHKEAYAISHTQVSERPYDFFVLNDRKVKRFGSWCIINLKILEKSEESIFPEGCMSFPYRDLKKTERWAHIKVKYQIPIFGGRFLWTKTKRLKNIDAFICQHEFDHARGENIYGRGDEPFYQDDDPNKPPEVSGPEDKLSTS